MDFDKLLKDHGLKVTIQRKQVLSAIYELDTSASNKNILNCINMDKSTMYRIIDLFINKGIIEKNINVNDIVYYSIKEHKHYIKCIKCHKKDLIDICPIDNIDKDYKILSHKIEIEGICNDCINKI